MMRYCTESQCNELRSGTERGKTRRTRTKANVKWDESNYWARTQGACKPSLERALWRWAHSHRHWRVHMSHTRRLAGRRKLPWQERSRSRSRNAVAHDLTCGLGSSLICQHLHDAEWYSSSISWEYFSSTYLAQGPWSLPRNPPLLDHDYHVTETMVRGRRHSKGPSWYLRRRWKWRRNYIWNPVDDYDENEEYDDY